MTNLGYAESIKAMQQLLKQTQKSEQQRLEKQFAPIRDAHNELVDAGACIKCGSQFYRLKRLGQHETSVSYSIGSYYLEKNFLARSVSNTPLEFFCNHPDLCCALDFPESFGRSGNSPQWQTNAVNFYLKAMSRIIVFVPITIASNTLPFWKRIIPQKWVAA